MSRPPLLKQEGTTPHLPARRFIHTLYDRPATCEIAGGHKPLDNINSKTFENGIYSPHFKPYKPNRLYETSGVSTMRRYCAAAVLLLGLVLSRNAQGQNFNASVGGFAQDTTQAFIPGVTI